MTDAEKLMLATAFTIGDHRIDPITVEMTDNGHGPHTGDGVPRWAVCSSGGACLEVGTRDTFVYEPSPSSRTNEWLIDHRFTSLDEALDAAVKAQGWRERRMAERAAKQ